MIGWKLVHAAGPLGLRVYLPEGKSRSRLQKIRESAMTWKAPKHAFDSDDLTVLDKAFEATWTVIQAQDPSFPPQREEEN